MQVGKLLNVRFRSHRTKARYRRIAKSALLSSVGLIFALPIVLSSTAFAQVAASNIMSTMDDPNQTGTIEPSVTGIGAKMSLADQRFIGIYKQAPNGPTTGNIEYYFHKPLFIFVTNPTPFPGLPDIVTAKPITRGGLTYLWFTIILTTAKFQDDVKAFVIANDPSLTAEESKTEQSEIRIAGWPIQTLSLKVEDPLTGQILGTWTSPPLDAAPGTIQIPVGFSDANLALFDQLAPTGDVSFFYSYTYSNVRVLYAREVVKATEAVTQALRNAISSDNGLVAGQGGFVFQTQVDQFQKFLSDSMEKEIETDSADLIPDVNSEIVDKFFSEQTIPDISSIPDKDQQDAIYAYLKPLIQTEVDHRTQTQSSVDTQQDGVTIKLGASGFGGSFEIDKTDMNTLQNTSGATFDYSTTDQAYEPTSIKEYTILGLTDEDTLDLVSDAFVTQGGDPNAVDDTPVKTNFTDKLVNGFQDVSDNSGYNGILPGMAFCYFGDEIPKGYLAVDPSNHWTDEAWMGDLRGKQMPDSQDLLLGFTNKPEEIGTVWNSGTISIPPIPLASNWLNLTSTADNDHLTVSVFEYFSSGSHQTDGPGFSFGVGQMAGGHGRLITTTQINYNYALNGSTNIPIPSVQLNSLSTTPQNLRCRLIVKQ